MMRTNANNRYNMILRNASILLLLLTLAWGQTPHGDRQYRTRNDHSGNLIRVTFHNHGMMGNQSGDDSETYGGEWPINSGKVQMGNASAYVGSEMKVFAGLDTISGDSTWVNINPVAWCQGWDPNRFDRDSLGRFIGFEPLPGYYKPSQKQADPLHAVAMSHMAFTWPPQWPDKLTDPIDPGWGGAWNGYFGKDQSNADQESYFVMDDYTYNERISGYIVPSPIENEPQRSGLGLRQSMRGLQWSNPDAEDCIFWIHNIRNIGEMRHYKTLFGMNIGASIGGHIKGNTDYNDDAARFFRDVDLVVNYDVDNIGSFGYTPVPWVGFAFLESPGNAIDGIDNDGDGIDGSGVLLEETDFTKFYSEGDPIVLIDYASEHYDRTLSEMPANGLELFINGDTLQANPQTPLIEIPRNLIDDNLNGIIDENDGAITPDSIQYYLYIRHPLVNDQDYLIRNYFTGDGMDNPLIDERRDDLIDNDGDWNPELDDVGIDGKSGTGDAGEGDGFPTPGNDELPGEPSIDRTDVSESDQIGLTSFIFYEYGDFNYSNEEVIWEQSKPGNFDNSLGEEGNTDTDYLFSTGYFPLMPGWEETFSVAMIYGEDEEDIVRNKSTVQRIYDSNYNFAMAPDKPMLTAVPGDGKVTLYWDDGAEVSWDRFLREHDFEGYKIYRSRDPGFEDSGEITDGYGYRKFTKPLAIYDKVDGHYGFFPSSFGTGVQFQLGSETGLVHTFVDEDVTNGVRYFYAVTAYDRGSEVLNISPTETNMMVAVNASGEIRTDRNVAVVMPRAPSLDAKSPEMDVLAERQGSTLSSGWLGVTVLDPDSVEAGVDFQIKFLDVSNDNRDNDGDGLIDGADPDEFLPIETSAFILNRLRFGDENDVFRSDTVWFYDEALDWPSRRSWAYDTTGVDSLWNSDGELVEQFAIDSSTIDFIDSVWVVVKDIYNDQDGDPNTFSTIMGGMEIKAFNPPTAAYNPRSNLIEANRVHDPEKGIYDGVRWGGQDLLTAYQVEMDLFNMLGFREGLPIPKQYKLVFDDSARYMSQTMFLPLAGSAAKIPIPGKAVNFQIYDLAENEPIPFGFVEPPIAGGNTYNMFSAKDYIVFGDSLTLNRPGEAPKDTLVLTYWLQNKEDNDTTYLQLNDSAFLGTGDTLFLYPDFPFNQNTQYSFSVNNWELDTEVNASELDRIKVVPNPFVVSAPWEFPNQASSGSGDKRIMFTHLPSKCTIRIYAVDGTLVKKLEHDARLNDGTEEWNLLTRDNMKLSYGVYIYHIDAPGIGEKVGRMIIIK